MRSIKVKAGSYRIAAGLLLCLGGCQPGLSENTLSEKTPSEKTPSEKTLATNSVPTIPVSAPVNTTTNSPTTTEPQEGAVEKAGNAAKIAVELKSMSEVLQQVATEKGKWTVVDVWSTSCIPCMKEFPHLVALSKKYPDKVRCVSVNVDYVGLKSKPPESYAPNVEEFLTKQKAEFKNYLSTTPDSDVFVELEIESIPAVMVFGPDGEKKKVFTDDNSGEDGVTYEGDILPWLEENLK